MSEYYHGPTSAVVTGGTYEILKFHDSMYKLFEDCWVYDDWYVMLSYVDMKEYWLYGVTHVS